MQLSRFPFTAATVLALVVSATVNAADITPQALLAQARAEQPAYLDTLKTLVSVDTGTGTKPGLDQVSVRCWSSACRTLALASRPARQPLRPGTISSAPSREPVIRTSC